MIFELVKRSRSAIAFSPLVDAFHPCFPASVGEYILGPLELNGADLPHGQSSQSNDCPHAYPCLGFEHNEACHGNASANGELFGRNCASDNHRHGENSLPDTSGAILNLPREVSDLILSYLSSAALDAARYACKGWWTTIVSNTWVLSSVLGVREELLSGRLSHRDLLKKWDRDSDLHLPSSHLDAWRTRFRTRDLDFSIPSPSSLRTRPTFVAAARAGTQNGWLVFQLQDRIQDTRNRFRSTLVVYRFDLNELVCYAGAAHDVEGQGAMRIIGVEEIRRHREWVLRIDIGDTAGLYSIAAKEGFSNSGSRYSLETLKPSEGVPGLSEGISSLQGCDNGPELLSTGDRSWNFLAHFQPNEEVSAWFNLNRTFGNVILRSTASPCLFPSRRPPQTSWALLPGRTYQDRQHLRRNESRPLRKAPRIRQLLAVKTTLG